MHFERVEEAVRAYGKFGLMPFCLFLLAFVPEEDILARTRH